MNNQQPPLVHLSEAVFAHDDAPAVFHGVSMSIHAGDRIALLGPNGAGKSTLFRLLCGAWQPVSGQLTIKDKKIRYSKKDRNYARSVVQLVLQEPDDQIFALSVRDDVSFGPMNQGLTQDVIAQRVADAMETAEISDLADRVPQQLSYGQRKRVALAGALAMQPEVLLLDEPTAGLDPAGCAKLLETLERLDAAVVLSTHDVNLAYAFATTVVVIHNQQLVIGHVDELMCNQSLLTSARLEIPWAPFVSAALGTTITTPKQLIGWTGDYTQP